MLRYTVQRLIAMAITLFIIITISFFLLRLMPGSFVDDPTLSKEIVEQLENKYHLNDPLVLQYGYFLKDAMKLDFGVSLKVQPKRTIGEILAQKIPISMQLNIFSMIFMIPMGIILGIIAAIRKNKLSDHGISVLVILFISVPSFVFASALQYWLGFKLDWFPIVLSKDQVLNWNRMRSMILPILALSFGGIATITRYVRAELCEALNSEYMLLSKSKGLTQFQSTVRHAMRNSFVPLANIIIPIFTSILFGSLVIEKIFAIPGMGGVLIDSINAKDHTLTIGLLCFYSLISLLTILIVDLSYGIIDPRIRIGGRK
ncbi:ABC transporter permease [Wukongibacter sp. M2B1]|uniref:ABC transporter permease n=1 Tax=Wukongibacter sp. M2B1 TaxID=3088895 RepID=UPI003D7A59BB